MSDSARFPEGLANSSGLVGRYLTVQANQAVWGVHEDEIRSYKAPPSLALTEHWNYEDRGKDYHGGWCYMSQGPLPTLWASTLANGRGLWGDALVREMQRMNHTVGLKNVGEYMPQERNRVTLADETDQHGLPIPRVTYSWCDNDRAMNRHSLAFMRQALEAAGARDLGPDRRHMPPQRLVPDGGRPRHLRGGRRLPLLGRAEPLGLRRLGVPDRGRREPLAHHPGRRLPHRRPHPRDGAARRADRAARARVMAKLIEDYGLIGDGRSAALVRRDGSIDWLCWPRFDSDACLAALLGTEEHGRWLIGPAEGGACASRRYQPDTLVLETDFEAEGGAARVTDFMPVGDGAPTLVRIVTGLRGRIRLRHSLLLRFDYGSLAPWVERRGETAVARVGPDLVVLRGPVAFEGEGDEIAAEFELGEGDERAFVLAYGPSHEPPPEPIDAKAALAEAQAHWREWIQRFDEPTDWPEAVRRSLLTLKAMIHRPTGSIVAAPTTSLPETFGGSDNWDYRFAWMRDSTFALAALLDAGFEEEAVAWRDWLLRAVAGDPDKMRIMYHVDGSRRLEEWTVDWLPGFRWSTPVRVGNAAAAQFQLDIYGEVIDTLHLAARAGMERDEQGRALEAAVVRHVERVWRDPDHGLWESRGEPRHYVYSKVMAWVAVDRCASARRAQAQAGEDDEGARLGDLARLMHAEICREGFDADLGHFVARYGGREVDASLLLLPLMGFLPVDDPRMAGTIAAVERDLVVDGLVRRNAPVGQPPPNAFLACSCWLADCQAMQGREQEARATFERLLSVQSDLGLLAEEYDPEAGRLTGNFPQALSHLALIRTALGLCGTVTRRGGEGAS